MQDDDSSGILNGTFKQSEVDGDSEWVSSLALKPVGRLRKITVELRAEIKGRKYDEAVNDDEAIALKVKVDGFIVGDMHPISQLISSPYGIAHLSLTFLSFVPLPFFIRNGSLCVNQIRHFAFFK